MTRHISADNPILDAPLLTAVELDVAPAIPLTGITPAPRNPLALPALTLLGQHCALTL